MFISCLLWRAQFFQLEDLDCILNGWVNQGMLMEVHVYVANSLMQTESKHHTVFIPNMLPDWLDYKSDSMLRMKSVSCLLSVCIQ